jgi:hypothetical protein
MKNETALNPATLATKAVEWWCPDRTATRDEDLIELTAAFEVALAALEAKDWGEYHTTLNHTAAGTLGYDTVAEEEELLAFLDDLCRGYR